MPMFLMSALCALLACASLPAAAASVLPRRKQYAAPSCSGRVTGHSFTSNFECVPPNNFMGAHWVKAFCNEVGGNVTFEQYQGVHCTGEVIANETFPSACASCDDPGYQCYGGGLRTVSISCISSGISSRGSAGVSMSMILLTLVEAVRLICDHG
ncbi:unnamed protein product [Symbiodinium sp. CCMP2592]|nr:unnamed protein product [Symbiodinium sp. CCMP2592]